MDIHKNEKSELRLWAKDDIVPRDLQALCKQAATSISKLQKRIKELEALRDTVSISCHPPKDCNDPEVLKTYMKGCYDQSQKLY